MTSATVARPLLLAAAWTAVAKILPYALSRLGMSLDPDVTVYPWNFSPLVAVAVVGGMRLTVGGAVALPVAAWLLADLCLLAILPFDWVVYPGLVYTYGAMAAAAVCGRLGRGGGTWSAFASAAGGVAVFFLISNFGTWATGAFGLYPRTAEGLLACYAAALPFLRNTAVATAVFTPLLLAATARAASPVLAEGRHATAEPTA